MAPNAASEQGIVLISILLNASLFGLVSQQFYAYWTIGFKDSIRLRLFVIVQFIVAAFQSLILWHFAWILFVKFPSTPTFGMPPPSPVGLWEGPINSLGQLVIILMVNMYLASRIYGLTKSRVKSGVVIALSVTAFILGVITDVMGWKTPFFPSVLRGLSVAWHAVQAVAECLITFFLSRMLLKSRSGVRRTDSTVNYIVRGIIQTGCLATAWALVALATYFLLPHNTIYRVFDVTSGTVYMHAMFETLLSRIRLRERMKLPSYQFELGSRSQEDRRTSSKISSPGGLRASVSVPKVYDLTPQPFRTSMFEPRSTPADKNDVIELESRVVE